MLAVVGCHASHVEGIGYYGNMRRVVWPKWQVMGLGNGQPFGRPVANALIMPKASRQIHSLSAAYKRSYIQDD